MTYINVLIEVWITKLKRLFGVKLDESVIPDGVYCYVSDVEKNNNKSENDSTYYIKTCPYYRYVGRDSSACIFDGFIGSDILHNDQCKVCGINDGYDE